MEQGEKEKAWYAAMEEVKAGSSQNNDLTAEQWGAVQDKLVPSN